MSGPDAFADDGFADRASPPTWPETREEMQARLTEEIEQGRAEVERRRAERLAAEAVEARPDWQRFTCLNQMTQRAYATWVDSGKPKLGPPPSPPPQPAPPGLVTKQALETRIDRLAEACAEGTGEVIAIERLETRKHVESEIAKARDEAMAREAALAVRLTEMQAEAFGLREQILTLRSEIATLRRERVFDQARATAEPAPNGAAAAGGRSYVS